MASVQTISGYLIERLRAHSVDHIFGVPGDYVLRFFHQLEESPLQVINTCDEQGAGFAADAYARVRGMGAVCVTYCVGGLKVVNTTAEAFAEKSPVVVISGAPGRNERKKNPLLHHKVKEFDTQLKVFEQVTIASTVLDDPKKAFSEIDRVLAAAMRTKRPVYIELPRDMILEPGIPEHTTREAEEKSDPKALQQALNEAIQMINKAHRPVIVAGVELHRFGFQDALLKLVEKTNIPVAATLLGKSVIAERHALYLGVYEGAMGQEEVRKYVESSDCVILLGAFMSDVNLGIYTAKLDQEKSLYVTSEKTSIGFHTYEDVYFKDMIDGLLAADIIPRERDAHMPHPSAPPEFKPERSKKITIQRLFQRLNSFIEDDTVVIADPGDAMFAGADLFIHGRTEFLAPAYYTSMGFAVPASLGVQFANPRARPLVLVGDGAFQMTGMELATSVRFKLNPVVVILNNGGYGTERPMQDGEFNNIQTWRYSEIPKMLGAGKGFDVETEGELEKALQESRNTSEFCILDVHLEKGDSSKGLKRLTAALGKKIHQISIT